MSILNHEGQFAVGGGSDLVDAAVRQLGPDPSAVLVVHSEGLEPEDWVDLGEAKVERRFNLVMVVCTTSSPAAYKVADAVVRSSDGGNSLVDAVRRFVGSATPLERQMGTKNPVFIAESLQQTYGGRRLTRRELEVAQYVAQGLGNRRISQVLNLQEQSVKNLVSSIMRKLNCENRTQVALKLTGQTQPA